jgi:hypothetical protein
MTRVLRRILYCLLLIPGGVPFAQADKSFSGLPYDAAQIRRTIERYSLRVEANAGAWEIPGSVSYRLFVQKLLSETNPEFAIEEQDLLILRNLAVASTGGLAGKHDGALRNLCTRIALSDGSRDDIVELATLFDQSRSDTEQELGAYFAETLGRLSPEMALIVEQRWVDFSANTTVVYTTFDMTGFAQELPEAAHIMLVDGCTKFHAATASR